MGMFLQRQDTLKGSRSVRIFPSRQRMPQKGSLAEMIWLEGVRDLGSGKRPEVEFQQGRGMQDLWDLSMDLWLQEAHSVPC